MDTPGQERYSMMMEGVLRNYNGYIIVFDLSKNEKVSSVRRWQQRYGRHFKNPAVKLLVGNKLDRAEFTSEEKQEINEFCKENEFYYIEASAMKNIHIEEIFLHCSDQCSQKIQVPEEDLEVIPLKKTKKATTNKLCC